MDQSCAVLDSAVYFQGLGFRVSGFRGLGVQEFRV